MRTYFNPINVPTSVAAGTALGCKSLTSKWVQIAGTFVATMDVEGTLNDADWFKVATGVSAPSAVEVPVTLASIRINVTAYTSGTPTATLGGVHLG